MAERQRVERLEQFNARHDASSGERDEHRQHCLRTALTSGLTAGSCSSGLALAAMLARPNLVRNTSMKSFVLVISFFLPFSLSARRSRRRPRALAPPLPPTHAEPVPTRPSAPCCAPAHEITRGACQRARRS